MSTCWRKTRGYYLTTRHMSCHRREKSGVCCLCLCVSLSLCGKSQMFRLSESPPCTDLLHLLLRAAIPREAIEQRGGVEGMFPLCEKQVSSK